MWTASHILKALSTGRLYTLNLETDFFTLSSGNVSDLSPKLLIVVISSKPPPPTTPKLANYPFRKLISLRTVLVEGQGGGYVI